MNCGFLRAQEISENAKKYLSILSAKPTPGFMFERFYGAWMEFSDTKALEEFLKKASIDTPTSENILLLAFYYQKEGQINQALGVFNSIENAKLLTSEVLYYRARLESNALNFSEAIKHIDTAISLPLKEDLKQKLLKLKAQVQYRNGDSAGARKTFEDLLAINEKDKAIIEDVMEIQLSEGVYEDAKKYCQKLIDLATDNYEKVTYQLKMATILKRLNDSENSEKIYLELIHLSGQDSWLLKEVVYQFEAIYRGKDNLVDLIKKYEEIIKANPQNVYLRKRYSSLLSEKGEKELAIAEFKTIVELLPGDRSIKEEYAGLLISNDKTPDAIKILEAFANPKTGSKDYEIILSIADLEFKIKKVNEAHQWLQQFLGKPDLTEYEILRVCNILHKHDQVAKEIELLEKQSKDKPDAVGLKEALINLYLEAKDKDKALQIVNTLKISDDMDINFRIVNQFSKQKFYEDAVIILESTKKENKDSFRYLKRLYDLYSDVKNEDKKKEVLISVLKVCNSFTEIRDAIQLIKGMYDEKSLNASIEALVAKKDIDFKETILLAHLHYKANQQEQAVKVIEDSNAKFSNEILYMELKESFYSSIKEFEKAIQVIDELVQKSPKDNIKYLLLKTNLQRRAGNTDEAIASAKQLLVATNNKVEHVIILTELYQMKGEYEEAIKVLRKASFENPDEKSLKLKLADSYMDSQNFNDARRILWSMLEATDDITEKISYMDKIYNCYDYDLGVDSLIENLKERKLNNIKNTFPLLALIRVYQRLNDNENKSKYMIELSQLKTDDVRLYIELADVMLKDLNYDGAETALKKAVEIDKTELAKNKLIQYYFSVDKDDLATAEMLRLSKNALKENEIIIIADKYISSAKYEKAYQFLTSNVPVDRSVVYDYVLAIAARESKIDKAEQFFYNLLDKNEEFSKAQIVQSQSNYYLDDPFYPEMFKKIYSFQQHLWSYTSYQANAQNNINRGYYGGAVRSSNSIITPSSLKELHNYAIAHLGDIYREADESKKTEILNELKNRNIEYPELLLSMDKNKIRSGDNKLFSDLFQKHPENLEFKVLHILSDRSFFANVDSKLIPLVNEIKDKDKRLAFWLISIYPAYLKEIKEELVLEIETMMKELNVSEDKRLETLMMLFADVNNRSKIIAEDLIEKYKPTLLGLIDKGIDKDFAGLRNGSYYLMPLLIKFKDVERYAKIINKQLAANSSKGRNQNMNYSSYGRHGRYSRNVGSLRSGVEYPFILHQQLAGGQYYELYNKNNKIDEEFRKLLLPKIENIYLKLSIYHFLQNEEETEKLIKSLEESKTQEDLQIVAAYYGFKQKDKEAIIALNKALVLATTVDSKKMINAKIAQYASKTEDAVIKADGVNAAKRLKNFNLSKEELLELSVILESLGESSEAEKLDDKISKMNTVSTNSRTSYSNSMQNLTSKLDSMFGNDKNEAAFKLLISSLKTSFSGFSNQIKSNAYFQFDSYNFSQVVTLIKKKNVAAEFKKFIADQTSLSDDDLVTVSYILYHLEDLKEAAALTKKLIEKKPKEISYKIFAYILNLKNNSDLDDILKQDIKNNLMDAMNIIRNCFSGSRLFESNRYELKSVTFFILENLPKDDLATDVFSNTFIAPFLSNVVISKNVYSGSILNARANQKANKQAENKMLDDYFLYFEELMMKCIQSKVCPTIACSMLLHYYVVNEKVISNEFIQNCSEALTTEKKSLQNQSFRNYSSNGESLFPLDVSLSIYLLNKNKEAELDSLIEKMPKEEVDKLKKFVEKLKLFYAEKPITKEDIVVIGESISGGYYNQDGALISLLCRILPKMEVKNNNVYEFLLTNLKNEFSQERDYYDLDQNAISKYIGDQLKKYKGEEAIEFLINIEKRLLPKPFDKQFFEKNKNNWSHYTKIITGIFLFERGNSFDIDTFKHILLASLKSEFYFYITRSNNNYFWKLRQLSIDDILSSGLFTGKFSEIQVVMFSSNSFLLNDVIRNLKDSKKQEAIEKLGKLEKTDGVTLLSYWVEGNSYQKVFDFLGSKLDEFKNMPKAQKVEWSAFLAHLYKKEIAEKKPLSELGLEFKSLVENLDNDKLEEAKKRFLEDKVDEEMSAYDYLRILEEVYPSIVSETEEKVLAIIKSAKRKHKFLERNHSSSSRDRYLHDEFVEKLIRIQSTKKNHLVVATELLSQSLKWPPDYYRSYSSLVRFYIKEKVFELIKNLGVVKNKNGKYVLDADQAKAFKSALNAAIDEVVVINKNSVPIYMISFGEELGAINGKDTALQELVTEWAAEKEISSLKKDIYFEFQSFLKKDNSILENHFLKMITNTEVPMQVKTFYIESILSNTKPSKETQKIVLAQQLNIILADGSLSEDDPGRLQYLIEKYDFDVLKESSSLLSGVVKNWYRNFEKALLESTNDNWRLDNYGVKYLNKIQSFPKILKLLREHLDEKLVAKYVNTANLEIKTCFPVYLTLIKEGFEKIVLDAINGNIGDIKINLNQINNLVLTEEDLVIIESFLGKIVNQEKRDFARVLFYRMGVKTEKDSNSLKLFSASLKEMIKKPVKDLAIRKKLLELLLGTDLNTDAEIIKLINDTSAPFEESMLKTSNYQDIASSFKLYSARYSKILNEKGLEEFKGEVNKTIAVIKENENTKDPFILTISDSLAENLLLEKNILKSANAYFEAITHVLDSFGHCDENGKYGLNIALCLLFLNNKKDKYADFTKRFSRQHLYHWEKELSTENAIRLFKTVYLQNVDQSAGILKSINEFFSSNTNRYYDYLPEEKTKGLFDFIANEADRKLVIENYTKFNQENKSPPEVEENEEDYDENYDE